MTLIWQRSINSQISRTAMVTTTLLSGWPRSLTRSATMVQHHAKDVLSLSSASQVSLRSQKCDEQGPNDEF